MTKLSKVFLISTLATGVSLALLVSIGCGPAVSSHPSSSVRRVYWLLREIRELESQCLASRKHLCWLDELPLVGRGKWGTTKVVSHDQLAFEEYDLRLVRTATGYCVGAIPTRESASTGHTVAIWLDNRGNYANVPHPWKQTPPFCDVHTDADHAAVPGGTGKGVTRPLPNRSESEDPR